MSCASNLNISQPKVSSSCILKFHVQTMKISVAPRRSPIHLVRNPLHGMIRNRQTTVPLVEVGSSFRAPHLTLPQASFEALFTQARPPGNFCDSGLEQSWHTNVIFAAKARSSVTTSRTPTTPPVAAGTSTCSRSRPRSPAEASAFASAPAASRPAKSSRAKPSSQPLKNYRPSRIVAGWGFSCMPQVEIPSKRDVISTGGGLAAAVEKPASLPQLSANLLLLRSMRLLLKS